MVGHMHFVYLLQSDQDGSFYVGITQDLDERLKRHNAGYVYYTSRKTPWELVYYEAYLTKPLAEEREKQLKRFGSAHMSLLKRLGYK